MQDNNDSFEPSEITTGLKTMQSSIDDFCGRQETKLNQYDKKMNQLWAAVGGSQNTIKENKDMTYHTKTLGNDEGLRDFVKVGMMTKSLSTADETGSYMVPYPVQEHIQQALMQNGSIRSLARVSAISSDALEVMVDGDAGEVGWVAEKGDRDETKAPAFHRRKVRVHELYSKPMISQKLLDDAALNVEEWLVDNIAASMNRLENGSFVNGDGDGKPMGFLSYGMVPVGQGTFGKIEWVKTGKKGGIDSIDVLYDAVAAMKPTYLDSSVWYVSRSAIAQIRRLKTKDGLPIWQPSIMQGQPDMLLGYPVVVSDDMPQVREDQPSVPMVFANFKRGYQVVDRHDMRLLRDPYTSKPFVEFYATKRVGGDVIDFDAIKAISFSE